ncbi:hypothetical protein [Oceanobacillus caeni]|uniref:Uncharacterized protein n=1 Tax=Oceanobacillus caeni TaxID=405946 RepID=A0ABR5MK79_9BACI|nr:hypothetical protein [Oceanobacillus caeni]KPH76063.1 hypothetical protein AFL42_07075 [Oceanobacillus caeni]
MGKAQLREMLIEIQKEEALREFLGDKFNEATDGEKEHFLSFVINEINNDVDKMLNEHVEQHLRNLPEQKSHIKLMIFYTSFSILLTGLSGYAINEKNWAVVVFAYVLLIATQSLPYIINKK